MCVSCFSVSPQMGLITNLHSSIHREIHSSINDMVNIRANVRGRWFPRSSNSFPIVYFSF